MKASFVFSLLLCASCGHAAMMRSAPKLAFSSPDVEGALSEKEAAAERAREAPPPAGEPALPDRKIIFHGSLLLQVPDPTEPEKQVRSIVEEAEGWVHKIERSSFTLRVPAARFHDVLGRLATLGNLIDRKVSGTDVTEEYLDLGIRIQNAENLRKRLIALLEMAKDVKEALAVERELARVTGEIERMKGRLKFLKDQVAFSTIVVTFQRTVPVHVASRGPKFPFPWIRDMGIDDLLQFRNSP